MDNEELHDLIQTILLRIDDIENDAMSTQADVKRTMQEFESTLDSIRRQAHNAASELNELTGEVECGDKRLVSKTRVPNMPEIPEPPQQTEAPGGITSHDETERFAYRVAGLVSGVCMPDTSPILAAIRDELFAIRKLVEEVAE